MLDTSGIQPYIFSSNRLPEIIGASQLVEEVTREWVFRILNDLFEGAHNVEDISRGTLNKTVAIERDDDGLEAEIIYAGGGNTAILFRTLDAAHDFTRALTTRVLREAPGIQVIVAHTNVDWQNDALAGKVKETVERRIADRKRERSLSMPLLGLGVTALCESTGLPATGINDDAALRVASNEPVRLLSRETQAKLRARSRAKARLARYFSQQLAVYYEFPSDFEELGRVHGEESYIAVVHADGNRMGQRVKQIAEAYSAPSQNRQYIVAMRDFSASVSEASLTALRALVQTLTRRTVDPLLPFRPLIFGGDDVTFVCNGRLGIPLAAMYLDEFHKQDVKVAGQTEQLYACAGICIIKSHYPFSRAAEISERLTHEAKTLAKENGGDGAALDWHLATTGLSGDLHTIRTREYTPRKGEFLYLRPVRLHATRPDIDGRSWERVRMLIDTFNNDAEWADKRNKLKALRDALRQGPQAVREFRAMYELKKLPELVEGTDYYREDGWQSGRCGYFDALELMDHCEALEAQESIATEV
jgi:hypothetical protein